MLGSAGFPRWLNTVATAWLHFRIYNFCGPLRSGEVTFENMIERSAPCKLPSLESSQSGTSLQRGDRATLRTLNAYRLAGVYAACILNGEKPGELPAQQAMKECGASRREHV